jgi:hypothetical protein
MPTSKHRRKGKPRPRGKVNNAIPPRPIVDPEDPWRQDAVLAGQLQKMFGGNDWTDAQIDAALDEIDREEDAMFLATVKQRTAPEPQQLELFPVNSLAETSR